MLLWSLGPRWDGDETAASVVGILRTRHLSRQSRLCPREPSVRNDSFGPGVLRRCREAHWRPFRWVGGRLAWANQRRRWRTVLVLSSCANATKSETVRRCSLGSITLSRPQAARAVYTRWAVLGRYWEEWSQVAVEWGWWRGVWYQRISHACSHHRASLSLYAAQPI